MIDKILIVICRSMKKRVFVFWLLAGGLAGCGQVQKTKLRKIDPVRIINLKNDLAIGRYRLTCGDAHLIASDAKTSKISIFKYNGVTSLQVIGRPGRGPGEFVSLRYVEAYDNKIFAADIGNRRISVFNAGDGTLKNTITHATTNQRYVILDGSIYLNSPITGHPTPFMKINMANESTAYFGKRVSNIRALIRMTYNILGYRNKIIAVSTMTPVIKFYNKKGSLLSTRNLSKDKNLAGILAYKKHFKQTHPSNENVELFGDATVYKNDLILKFNSYPQGKWDPNKYLVYRISGTSLKKVGAFQTNVHGGYTTTFCTYDGKLYSNGVGINIFVFSLKFLDKNSHKSK
jgi:hypothetical protein